MSYKTFLSSLAVIALIFASTTEVKAEESPEKLLEQTISDVLDLLHAPEQELSLDSKRTQILTLLQERFSFDIIIRRALGRNWNELSATQQDQITVLISDLLIRAYTRELENGPKPNISIVKTDDLGSNKIEIVTSVRYKSNFVSVSYRLANVKSRGWQVYDVLIEGVSMVSNYRKQFDEHFQTKSAADLLEMLRGKLKE
ncbi:ABC transporter substrate-binding protein [Pelagicoccus sp. SDUM812002]|uniref:MlaC/ttg2D family ABC transporter substrate-binding protein n=1 Tax=Pelagicoccus sp. SDUM812002 TaxID=3041266 RepID=UPI00280FC7E8|nr:ABC transporter substrate-binding protein [Pelagicoccus sp. SDUM812002]MDQ8187508.1 ABC transporter substrate-binding protein [Pelagicoccus sp. SDUM812002]